MVINGQVIIELCDVDVFHTQKMGSLDENICLFLCDWKLDLVIHISTILCIT